MVAQSLRLEPAAEGAALGFDLLATDGVGQALTCDEASLSVQVEVAFDGGEFVSLPEHDVVVSCGAEGPMHLGLVLDNSGSQEDVLEETRAGAKALVDAVLERGGEASVVRVSTGAQMLLAPSSDPGEVDAALEGLFVNDGWTALYDGLRLAHEVVANHESSFEPPGVDSCTSRRRAALVMFSNGRDNNSDNAQSDLDDDGFDTTLDDLLELEFRGSRLPVFSIGLGEHVDHDALQSLADHFGGKHLQVSDRDSITSAFETLADYGPRTLQVCAPVEDLGCGLAQVRITVDGDIDGQPYDEVIELETEVPCPPEPAQGRSATVLLTLSNPGLPTSWAETLADNTALWVGDGERGSIAIILDDNHHGEFAKDAEFIAERLRARGWTVTLLEEPEDGIGVEMVQGYDVLWLTNPGWPVDDRKSMETLSHHLASGRGVILSGDDMSWSYGHEFPMRPWVHLDHQSNGTKTCGHPTDNNEGRTFLVTFEGEHPIIGGLEGRSFDYGDDIDHSTPAGDGENVLAWAELNGEPDCTLRTPVVVAFEPPQ